MLSHMFVNYSVLQKILEHLIHATPSGEARNHLCDANIHIMKAQELTINEAVERAKEKLNEQPR